ncbi:MAG: DUF302 domain-containing protein [Minwuia sp.]|nr:DUF302 domain-containing protein [Minwuia sp.]
MTYMRTALALMIVIVMGAVGTARADGLPGSTTVKTDMGFGALVESLDRAVEAEGFFVVTRASASVGASRRGVTIPGNMVVGVYRNDYAVRMLEASVPSGIEAPPRFYITANADGTASLTWRAPSAIFAPYDGGEALTEMAAELDVVWAAIAQRAVTK